MAEVEILIAGRSYRVGCRAGEEDNLQRAAAMVDAKSREALAGLGTLSESRQMLFASLLLADQLIDDGKVAGFEFFPPKSEAMAATLWRASTFFWAVSIALEIHGLMIASPSLDRLVKPVRPAPPVHHPARRTRRTR